MTRQSHHVPLGLGIWKIIPVVMLGPFMTQMDSTIVNVSLGHIASDLHAGLGSAQWVVTGYLLALALILPLNSVLVSRLGAKKLYLVCFSLFTVSSLLCGMATSMQGLITARVIQGATGGLLTPLAQLMIARLAGNQMVRVLGFAALPVLTAPLIGPLLAGGIVKHFGWPWLFYVNLPVGVLALILAGFLIPDEKVGAHRGSFDWRGFVLLSPGLASILYGFDRLSHGESGAWFCLGGVFLCCMFLLHAMKQGERALIDIGLFEISSIKAAALTQFLGTGIMYGGQFLIPLFLTVGCGLSALEAGTVLGAMGVGMICVYPLVGLLTDRFGLRRVATAGVLLNLAGTLPFLWMTQSGYSVGMALVGLIARGVGQGATNIPSVSAAYVAVPRHKLSLAAMTMNIIQRLGGPFLTTAIGIAVSLSHGSTSRGVTDFEFPFLVLIGFQGLVFLAAQRLPKSVADHPAALDS